MTDFDPFLDFLANGLVPLPWWGYVVVTLALTHVTIAAVTIFLHRCQAHRALDLHPAVSHFFRFWLWLTTGMVTKEWAAIHRKHHAKVETEDDPHSPMTRGIETVVWRGAELYRAEARNAETIERYGHGTPDDWLERNVYARYSWQGVGLMLAIDLALFGAILAWRNKRWFTFVSEVAVEVSQVTWPTKVETRVATIVVVVLTIICSVILAMMDLFWSNVTDWLYAL